MSVQVIPAEIFDLFVDQIGLAAIEDDDPESRTALLACTRVNTQFHRRASSYIFSSLSISIQRRLDGLRDILNANPYIARCIRSFTVEALSSFNDEIPCESLQLVLKQLSLLQKFGWISQYQTYDTHSSFSTIGHYLFDDLPSLTASHFENIPHLPLVLFSIPGFCHLKSLTLVNVGFEGIRVDALSGSLFSSLERLEIAGALWSDEDVEAVKTIMVCAAPTLTTLILFKTMFMYCESFFPRFFLAFFD
jgi:hypothetical protein